MKNLILKISASLLGESLCELKNETTKSKQKVILYGTILLMIMIFWFINGYLITSQILHFGNLQAIIVGLVSMFIVYTIELTIIRMSKVNALSGIIRVFMALIIAFIGSLCIDEIIFKADIENQLKQNIQNETQNIPSIAATKNRIIQYESDIKNLDNLSMSLRDQMILESKTGYGPKTKLIERQLKEINERKIILSKQNHDLIDYQQNELLVLEKQYGIIKNLQAFIDFNNKNKIGWVVWSVFFLFFLLIELMCLIYKISSDITSFERKKENIDSFERIKFKNLQDYIDDDKKRALNTYYTSLT
jgi:hypothetical protein